MFFRKKRAAEKAARDADRQHILDDIDTRFAEAKSLADPAEKILKLKKLEDDIEKSSKGISDEASGAMLGRGFRDGFGVFSTAATVSIWLACCVNPWFLALMIPGLYATGKIGSWSARRLEDRRCEENAEFFTDISERTQAVRLLCGDLVKNDWSEIAKSPEAEKVFDAVPILRAKCATAFAKGVSSGDIPVRDNGPSVSGAEQLAQDAVVARRPIEVSHSLRFKKPAAPR